MVSDLSENNDSNLRNSKSFPETMYVCMRIFNKFFYSVYSLNVLEVSDFTTDFPSANHNFLSQTID